MDVSAEQLTWSQPALTFEHASLSLLFISILVSLQDYFLPLTTLSCCLFPVFSYFISGFLLYTILYGIHAMVDIFAHLIVAICAFISNVIHALRTVVGFEPVDLQAGKDFMEQLSPRQLALKQLKDQFLQALQANDTREVLKILNTGKLDIDTVLEVDDPSMVLASYKQGETSLVTLH